MAKKKQKERFKEAFEGTPLARFCQKYEFKEADVKKIFAMFEKVDKDSSGERVFQRTRSGFGRRTPSSAPSLPAQGGPPGRSPALARCASVLLWRSPP